MTVVAPPNVRIARVTKATAARVADLYDRELGDVFTADDVLRADVSIVAYLDGELAGAATATITDLAGCARDFTGEHAFVVALLPFTPGEPVGDLQGVAVEPRARRHGLGTLLLAERIARLQARGVKRLIATAWESDTQGCHAAPILEAAGLHAIATCERFYEDIACPLCEGRCSCAAIVYVR